MRVEDRSAKGGKYLRGERRVGRWTRGAYACGLKERSVVRAKREEGKAEEEEVEKQLPSGKTRNRNGAAGRPVQGAGAPTIHPSFFFLP